MPAASRPTEPTEPIEHAMGTHALRLHEEWKKRRAAGVARDSAARARLLSSEDRSPKQWPRTDWLTELFTKEGDRFRLNNRGEASSALLAGFAEIMVALHQRMDALPDELRHHYLHHYLGLEARGAVPQRLLAAFDGQGLQAPLVIEPDTVFLGAPDAVGAQRRYRSRGRRTVSAARLRGLWAYFSPEQGAPRGLVHRVERGALPRPVSPFGLADAGSTARTLYLQCFISCATLSCVDENTTVFVRFKRVGPTPQRGVELLGGLDWCLAGDKGEHRLSLVMASVEGADVVLRFAATGRAGISEQCQRWALPPVTYIVMRQTDAAARERLASLAFEDLSVTVQGHDIAPQGYWVDGVPVDPEQPITAFGVRPHKSSSFAIQHDALFSLDLEALRLEFDGVEPTEAPGAPQQSPRKLLWERRARHGWLACSPDVEGTPDTLGPTLEFIENGQAPFSEVHQMAGGEGRFLRCRLAEGDYGVQAYEDALRAYQDSLVERVESLWTRMRDAVTSAGTSGRAPRTPVPPRPPTLSAVRLRYRTRPSRLSEGALSLHAGPDMARPLQTPSFDGRVLPFAWPRPGVDGSLLIAAEGLRKGATVGLFVDVQAVVFDARAQPLALHLYCTDGWRELEVVDDTVGLSRDGLIQFEVPQDAEPNPACPLDRLWDPPQEPLWWLGLEVARASRCAELSQLRFNVVELEEERASAELHPPDTRLRLGAAIAPSEAIAGVTAGEVIGVTNRGYAAQTRAEFLESAARRLRHRDRAVAPVEVEAFLSEQLPWIAQVRCLRPRADDPQPLAGRLRVVVVADVDQRYPVATAEQREELLRLLSRHVAANCVLELLEPVFSPILVNATLRVSGRAGVPLPVVAQSAEHALQSLLRPKTCTSGQQLLGKPLLLASVRASLERVTGVDEIVSLDFGGPHLGQLELLPTSAANLFTSALRHALRVVR